MSEIESADMVNHPPHYTSHPSGIECIQITEHMGFCIGNAIKYLWRADEKGNALEDLEKAKWYIEREIAKRKAIPPKSIAAGFESLVGLSTTKRPLLNNHEQE